jgi:hypothetical protein
MSQNNENQPKGNVPEKEIKDNRSKQLNPQDDAYWQSRGFEKRPDKWQDGWTSEATNARGAVKDCRFVASPTSTTQQDSDLIRVHDAQ